MPLVRISHLAGKPQAFADALSHAVHDAMVETFNVPADDYFQIVTEHAAKIGLRGPARFLDVAHSDDLAFIQITCSHGRTLETKRALYAAIVAKTVAATGLRAEDVVINSVETARENWSFGLGQAQYA